MKMKRKSQHLTNSQIWQKKKYRKLFVKWIQEVFIPGTYQESTYTLGRKVKRTMSVRPNFSYRGTKTAESSHRCEDEENQPTEVWIDPLFDMTLNPCRIYRILLARIHLKVKKDRNKLVVISIQFSIIVLNFIIHPPYFGKTFFQFNKIQCSLVEKIHFFCKLFPKPLVKMHYLTLTRTRFLQNMRLLAKNGTKMH